MKKPIINKMEMMREASTRAVPQPSTGACEREKTSNIIETENVFSRVIALVTLSSLLVIARTPMVSILLDLTVRSSRPEGVRKMATSDNGIVTIAVIHITQRHVANSTITPPSKKPEQRPTVPNAAKLIHISILLIVCNDDLHCKGNSSSHGCRIENC